MKRQTKRQIGPSLAARRREVARPPGAHGPTQPANANHQKKKVRQRNRLSVLATCSQDSNRVSASADAAWLALARRTLHGWTQPAHARHHQKLPQGTVSRDLAAVREFWREFPVCDLVGPFCRK